MTFGVALLAALATLAITTTALLGSPVPLSFFVKQPSYYADFVGEYAWNPYLFLKAFFVTAWPFVVAAIMSSRRKSWRQLVVLVAPALAIRIS